MKKKKILIALIVLVILIIGICLAMLVVLKQGEESKSPKDNPEVQQSSETIGLSKVTDTNSYFLVKNCIEQYNNYVSRASMQEGSPMGEDVGTKETILKLLDAQYVQDKQITVENIASRIPYGTYDLSINKMYQWQRQNGMETYLVYGTYIETLKKEAKENYGFMVRIDTNNKTYAILPNAYLEEKGYTNLKEKGQIEPIMTEIKNEYDNLYTERSITEAQVANEYFSRYKKNLLFNTKQAYDMLNPEYRDKRFGNVEEYVRYIAKNREFFQSLQIAKYQVTNEDGRKQYVCQDKYKNLYIFDTNGILEFDVKLDTYTLANKKFTEAYQKASSQEKLAMNLDKVVQMINNRDYKTMYSVLDDRFKSNYFPTLENFETYMEEKFPIRYQLNFGTFQNENTILIQKVVLTDVTEVKTDRIEKTFFMKLEEDENFVLSFNVE